MCGRFQFTREAFFALQKEMRLPDFSQGELPLGMIYPSRPALILDNDPGHLHAGVKNFGIMMKLGGKEKRLINARSETALDKWSFRESLLQRRCIIPASNFYEWDADKEMISFFNAKEPVLYLAGFYQDDGFIILTTDANASIRPYHHRMPLVLNKNKAEDWIFDTRAVRELLHSTPASLEHQFVNKQPSLF